MNQLPVEKLPLQQGLSFGSIACDNKLSLVILHLYDEAETIRVKTGIFYTSLIAGCSCADDPTPDNERNEYCEVMIAIDKKTASAIITLVSE